MSAPVTDRPRVATRAAPEIPRQRSSGRGSSGADTAAKRAYARRDERLRRSAGVPRTDAPAAPRRAQFVLLTMGLLTTGLVLTLWLSTAAAADSYRLQDARDQARTLSEQSERLHREVAVLASPTELARRAGELGMVAVHDPARLVAAPDGTVTVVGEPAAVRAPAPPAPPSPSAQPSPPAGAPSTSLPTPSPAPSDAVVPPGGATSDAVLAAEDPAAGDD